MENDKTGNLYTLTYPVASYFSGDRVFNVMSRSYGYNLRCNKKPTNTGSVTSTVVATVDLDWFDSHFIFASRALSLGLNNMFVLKELQAP